MMDDSATRTSWTGVSGGVDSWERPATYPRQDQNPVVPPELPRPDRLAVYTERQENERDAVQGPDGNVESRRGVVVRQKGEDLRGRAAALSRDELERSAVGRGIAVRVRVRHHEPFAATQLVLPADCVLGFSTAEELGSPAASGASRALKDPRRPPRISRAAGPNHS